MTPVIVDAPPSGEPTVRVLHPARLLIPLPREPLDGWMTPTFVSPEIVVIQPVADVPAPPIERGAGGRHAKPDEPVPTRRWVDHLLTVLAVIGIAVTAFTVIAARSGLQPLVVRSGSMEPTIASGSMVLVRMVPASSLEPGNVVAVERPDHTRVTHRIVSIEHRGATASLTLKGDANTDPDPAPVVVAKAGLVVSSVSWLGRMGGFIASAKGGFALGWLVALVTLLVLRRRPT